MTTTSCLFFSRWRAVIVSIAVLCVVAPVGAHDPGLSALELRTAAAVIHARLLLSPQDAARAIHVGALSGLTPDQHSLVSARLGAFARGALELCIDGQAVSGRVEAIAIERDSVSVVLTYPGLAGAHLTVRSRIAAALADGHRQLLSVRTSAGTLVTEQMIAGDDDSDVIGVALDASRTQAARQFFGLGLEHILGGYDHLLFLAGLLLGVRRVRDVAMTATAFTIGHSLTLACAVLGLVHAPGSLIEPLIAASLAYVGIENLLRPAGGARPLTAGLFGLIHGFGFAGALRELGVGSTGFAVAVPLGAFNLGVEAGQIAVAMATWPVIQWMRGRPVLAARLVTACSLLVALCGAGWFVARVAGSVVVVP
jgi:hypothetical protein